VGAARALGLPADERTVRWLAAAELVLGGVALAVSSSVVAALVAVSYLGFAAVTVVALVRRLPIDSCGCFGRLETPPSWRHLLVLGVCAVGAAGSVAAPRPSLLERLGDGDGVVFAVVALALTVAGVLLVRAGRRPIHPA